MKKFQVSHLWSYYRQLHCGLHLALHLLKAMWHVMLVRNALKADYEINMTDSRL
jgi:hypothetical protein